MGASARQDEVDPRVERSHRLVHAAALAELAESGLGGFTIDGVSRRSGVARSTIYRHWPDKTTLIVDALESQAVQPDPEPASPGGNRARVRALVDHLVTSFGDSPSGASLPALVDAAARSPALGRLFHEGNARRRSSLTAAIEGGVADGGIDPSVEPERAAEALAGAVLYRRVMTDRPMESAEVDGLVTTVLGPPPRPRGRRSRR